MSDNKTINTIIFGAAYTTSFGQDTPMPVLAFDWNNGSNLMLKAILPTNIDLWYQAAARVRLGLNVNVEGNEYHGDAELFGVDDPRSLSENLAIA